MFLFVLMNQFDYLFLSLVKSAVNGHCPNYSAFNGKDLTEFIKMSYSQAIPVLVIDGLQNYFKSNPNNNPFANETASDKLKRIQWFGNVVAYERLYAKHEKAMADLARLYAKRIYR